MLAFLDIFLVILLLHIDLLVQDVEEQHARGALREFQHLQPLVESAHLQLDFVVLYQRDAHLEKIELAL